MKNKQTVKTVVSELKDYLVEYVGTKLNSEEVTVNMIAEVLAVDFPEFQHVHIENGFVSPEVVQVRPSGAQFSPGAVSSLQAVPVRWQLADQIHRTRAAMSFHRS